MPQLPVGTSLSRQLDPAPPAPGTVRLPPAMTPPGGAAFVVDHDLRYLMADGDALRDAGLRPEDLLGKTIFEALEPSLAALYEPSYRQALAGIPFTQEHAAHGRYYVSRGGPLRDDSGAIYGAVAISYDITSQKQVEQLEASLRESAARQGFLLGLSDALRPLTGVVEIQAVALRLLGEHLRANRVLYADILDGRDAIVGSDYVDGVDSISGRHPIDAFGPEAVSAFRRGDALVVDDVDRDPRLSETGRTAFRVLGVAASMGVSLVKDGRWMAVFAVHSVQPRTWSATERALLQETAERTWSAVDRARSAEALRAAHRTFRHLVDHSPFGVYAVDADFRLVQVSAGAQRVFENVRPLIGRDFAEVLRVIWPEPFASEAIGRFRHTLATGEPYHAPSTVERRRDSGTVESYDWKVERVVLPDGRFGAVCHFYDLSERQQYEEALRAADRQKDAFIAVLAHELRNPLAPMRMSIGLLRARGGDDPVVVQCRDVIDRQVAHLSRLLDDLLDVSRLSRGKLALLRRVTSLKEVLDGALETVRPLLARGGHRLAVHVPTEPIPLDADPARLVQVFANVLGNAAKYTDPGGQIRVAVQPGDRTVAVTVTDTGVGIAADMIDRVFDLFTQADAEPGRAEGGLGIGLALARQLVEMHGGTIRCESAGPGTGSTFTITLPVVAEAQAGTPELAEPVPLRLAHRVLVVDDNQDAADMTAAVLGHHGCDARAVYSGEGALQTAREFRPDVILLDLGMPGLDGQQTCRRIRNESWGAGILILALTGWGQQADRRETAQAGFDHHLVKPVDPDALMQLIQEQGQERGPEISCTPPG